MTMITRAALRQTLSALLLLSPAVACAKPADPVTSPATPPAAAAGVTLQEFVARQEKKLMAADTDGDGKISQAEFTAAAAGKGDPAKRFARIDTNGDGMLDKAEIDAMLVRRFQKMDTNGDGVLTPDERAAAMARMAQVAGGIPGS